MLLKAIGELNGVAGNHARSYFEMSLASIVIRSQPIAGGRVRHLWVRHQRRLPRGDRRDSCGRLSRLEFFIGGKIVKDMDPKQSKALTDQGVRLDRDPRRLLASVGDMAFANEER